MYVHTNAQHFSSVINQALSIGGHYAQNITPYSVEEYTRAFDCYIDTLTKSGYTIRKDTKELCSVFSLTKGMGDFIVNDAVLRGAKRLDCYEGYLVSLYMKHGFKPVKREPNWTAGQPDVVYMSI